MKRTFIITFLWLLFNLSGQEEHLHSERIAALLLYKAAGVQGVTVGNWSVPEEDYLEFISSFENSNSKSKITVQYNQFITEVGMPLIYEYEQSDVTVINEDEIRIIRDSANKLNPVDLILENRSLVRKCRLIAAILNKENMAVYPLTSFWEKELIAVTVEEQLLNYRLAADTEIQVFGWSRDGKIAFYDVKNDLRFVILNLVTDKEVFSATILSNDGELCSTLGIGRADDSSEPAAMNEIDPQTVAQAIKDHLPALKKALGDYGIIHGAYPPVKPYEYDELSFISQFTPPYECAIPADDYQLIAENHNGQSKIIASGSPFVFHDCSCETGPYSFREPELILIYKSPYEDRVALQYGAQRSSLFGCHLKAGFK